MSPILYWDLVRFVRRPTFFAARAALAAVTGLFLLLSLPDIDSQLIGSIARASEIVTTLTFTLQTFAIYLFVPALLAGSICEDRRSGRLELLLVTPMTKQQIVAEKLLVGVAVALAAILTMLPFIMLGTLMGGVEPNAVLRAELVSVVET